jgi:hypothetical protein
MGAFSTRCICGEEEFMNMYEIVSVIVVLPSYALLVRGILRRTIELNFETWLCWAVLQGMAGALMELAGMNHALAAVHAIGCTIVATLLWMQPINQDEWPWYRILLKIFECAFIVFVLSYPLNGKMEFGWGLFEWRMIACVVWMATVTIPTTIDINRKRKTQPLSIWIGFAAADAIGVLNGREWSIRERLYLTAHCVICVFLILLMVVARKQLRSAPSAHS